MSANMTAAKAFTLVEILVVVIILGVLAAMIIPQFTSATTSARASMLMDNLRIMRTQLEIFKAQHQGVPPGYPDCDVTKTPSDTVFLIHLKQSSTSDGATAPTNTPGYPYGPYMREIPVNPLNNKATVKVLADGEAFPTEPSDQFGWIYQPSTLTFKADCLGGDENGAKYFDY